MLPEEVYEIFRAKSGSSSISGIATLKAVIDCAKTDQPKTVLELGAGIGTISYAILKNSSAVIDAYEHDELCRRALSENLKGFETRMNILSDYNQLPPKRSYDLIVVDGGAGSSGGYDGGFSQAVGAYIMSLRDLKTIIVEGQRRAQKYWILKALRTRYVYRVTIYPDPLGGKKIGTRFDCRLSANEFTRAVNHFFERQKVF